MKFALITACYNGENYIKEWSDCVLKQVHRPLTAIFIDDCSSDDSSNMVSHLAKKFKKAGVGLRMFYNKRKHYYGGSLRRAMDEVDGFDAYGIFDVDDYIYPHAVSHVCSLYEKFPHVGHIYTQFEVANKGEDKAEIGFCRAPDKGENILTTGMKNIHIYSHFRTFRGRIPYVKEIFLKRGKYAVDQYMGMMLEEKVHGMYTPKICYRYYNNIPDSISSRWGRQRREYWQKMMTIFHEKRKQHETTVYPIVNAP